jgi:hypothetical protein
MDGPEGETHAEWGANLMHRLFDRNSKYVVEPAIYHTEWRDFCLYHSRFYAKRAGKPFSKLCVADKLAVALEPWWFYLPRAILSGEIHEYIQLAQDRTDAGEPTVGKYASMNVYTLNKRQWFQRVQAYLLKWVEEHKDMKQDNWTPDMVKRA